MRKLHEQGYSIYMTELLNNQKKKINRQWFILVLLMATIFTGAFIQKSGKIVIIKEYRDTCCYNYTDSMECLNNQIIYYKKFYKPKK